MISPRIEGSLVGITMLKLKTPKLQITLPCNHDIANQTKLNKRYENVYLWNSAKTKAKGLESLTKISEKKFFFFWVAKSFEFDVWKKYSIKQILEK